MDEAEAVPHSADMFTEKPNGAVTFYPYLSTVPTDQHITVAPATGSTSDFGSKVRYANHASVVLEGSSKENLTVRRKATPSILMDDAKCVLKRPVAALSALSELSLKRPKDWAQSPMSPVGFPTPQAMLIMGIGTPVSDPGRTQPYLTAVEKARLCQVHSALLKYGTRLFMYSHASLLANCGRMSIRSAETH